jgi:multimeric flavodoxin WrbA
MKSQITLINGSLGGKSGNTRALLESLLQKLESEVKIVELTLAENPSKKRIESEIRKSQGFLFVTGTYWDSWGSPLQKFLEDMTDLEGTDAWLGKPSAVVVTMHSVGGKEVLSRLQGVLSTFGCLIPPMCGMTYSLAGHLALKKQTNEFHSDFWQIRDLEVIGQNLLEALNHKAHWMSWPVDTEDPRRKWFFN